VVAAERAQRLTQTVSLGEQLIQAFLDVLSNAIDHGDVHILVVFWGLRDGTYRAQRTSADTRPRW
jgi:signal transduction histidine kinase